MSTALLSKHLRSFAFYLALGYLIVYAAGAGLIFHLSHGVITKSTRRFDRLDAKADSEEFTGLLNQDADGNWLAEALSIERDPPSTIFIVRVLNKKGETEFVSSRPNDITVPEWIHPIANSTTTLPAEGWSESYLPQLRRYIQVHTIRLHDGRILQVGKGSVLETAQKSMMANSVLIVVGIATLLSLLSALLMMFLTLRPIKSMTSAMEQIISTGSFESGAPPVTSSIAELDTLGHFFTVMIEKYASLIKAMRQTMDDLAHDFRTPLARIRGSAELTLRNTTLPPELSETLADIIEDCDNLQLQLQNLMDAREMESGFVALNYAHFNLADVVNEITELYQLLAEEKEITLTTTLPDSSVHIRADRLRLSRLLANLLDNAIKYTPKKGQVDIILKTDNEKVIFEIRDTGIGIPPEEQSLVWQRLFRGQEARSSEKGLGLGLNIVEVIAAAHGGTISLTSTPSGTTFTLNLPC